MYPISTGNPFMVQQSVSGTGVFNGSEYGRAKATLPNGDPNAVVRVSARLYGSTSNAYSVELVDRGASIVVPQTVIEQTGAAIRVILRRSSSAILATAQEVAAAINALGVAGGVCAIYGGTGNGVVSAAAAVLLTGGVNPVDRADNHTQYVYVHPVNTSGGFFYFEQEETITVRQFECKFVVPGGTYSVTVSRVNLNENLEPILAEAVPCFVHDLLTVSKPDIAFADVGILLHPRQGLLVEVDGGGLPGVVRFDVRKGARYPYL